MLLKRWKRIQKSRKNAHKLSIGKRLHEKGSLIPTKSASDPCQCNCCFVFKLKSYQAHFFHDELRVFP